MPNNIVPYEQTILAAQGEFNAAKVGSLSLIDSIYKKVEAKYAPRMGSTINAVYPDLPAFTNVGNNAIGLTDMNPGVVAITFSQHPGIGVEQTDFEEFETAVDWIDNFLDPAYKRALEYLNASIAALLTTANFPTNGVVQSTGAAEVTTTALGQAWEALQLNKVPAADPADMTLCVHPSVYRSSLSDPAWAAETMVGYEIAQTARRSADLGPAFGSRFVSDVQMPATLVPSGTGVAAGTVAINNGSAAVVGTATAFTAAMVGTNIKFASDPTQTPYRILSYTSATSITLASNYTGTNITGSNFSTSSYLSAYFHKYAIVASMRPLRPPTQTGNQVAYRPITLRGIPMRLMYSYQHNPSTAMGNYMTLDFGFGIGVARDYWGQLIQC